MKLGRVIEILKKVKRIHEDNPHLAMSDMTNREIIEALGIGIDAMNLIIELALEEIHSMKTEDRDNEEGN